jgi:long-chain acyl-CoA synthetase
VHPVIAAIGRHAAAHPGRAALSDGEREMSYAALNAAIAESAAQIRAETTKTVALCLDNSPEWVIADLALLAARLPCVPLPAFFSGQQQAHALSDAGVECLITDRPDACLARLRSCGLPAAPGSELQIAGRRLGRIWIGRSPRQVMPAGTVKVTYTSGTTGHPKGVCVGEAALAAVARSLAMTCRLNAGDRHLGVLPLATLLENVAVYAALSAGGRVILRPLEDMGILGASGARPDKLLAALESSGATTAVLVPQLLKALVERIEAGEAAPRALRFLAVGGAAVAPALLERAARMGLPVFEGYGLSECASVVALNAPGVNRRGTVGRPLPHVTISLARDGEILVDGAVLLGYCGREDEVRGPWPTGDLGTLDADGYLRITGRKKNCFITSYGRNVSPDWVEAVLAAEPSVSQAWISGEARPWTAAVIVARPGCPDARLDEAIARANETLPEYARVRRWLRAEEPFSFANGELTANGRLRREQLARRYGAAIESLYLEESNELLR